MLMPFFESLENILKARPGLLGTPITEILATSVSLATPLINIFSILVFSFTIVPGALVRLERTSSSMLYFLAISTERLLSTCAPRVASSSISSYEISLSFVAFGTFLGSAVKTPSTSV